MTTTLPTVERLVSDLERDGYIVVKSFLDKDLVAQARQDLEQIYAKDLEERKLRNADEPLFTHGSTKSVLTPPSHLVLGLPGKSRALDECYEKIFSNPATRDLLRATAGESVKIRDVNCRYMTGTRDEGDFLNPPHEWHRDSPGELCIAIPLNEVPAGDNGATSIVPGSHRYPWCPRWNAMFGRPFYVDRNARTGIAALTRLNPFNRLLHKHYLKDSTGAFAEPGDFYIFLNDTWHGRVPNLHGARPMIVMAGMFPTDFPFPDDPKPFDTETIEQMPPPFSAKKIRGGICSMVPRNREAASLTCLLSISPARLALICRSSSVPTGSPSAS